MESVVESRDLVEHITTFMELEDWVKLKEICKLWLHFLPNDYDPAMIYAHAMNISYTATMRSRYYGTVPPVWYAANPGYNYCFDSSRSLHSTGFRTQCCAFTRSGARCLRVGRNCTRMCNEHHRRIPGILGLNFPTR